MDATITQKFYRLLNHLLYTKSEFEIVADEIYDSRLKTALNGFSEESDTYIHELCLLLQPLGFEYQQPKSLMIPEKLVPPGELLFNNSKGNELQYICFTTEKHITATYRDILNGHFPFPVIRKIMIYQLSTLRLIFKKISFLNMARFNDLAK